MKKIMITLGIILLGFTLVGCEQDKDPVSFKVMAPIGTPALAQTYMQSTMPSLGEHITYEIETISGTDPLVAAFGSGSHDVIYAPTNLGAKLISTGVDYTFAGTVVWGNLYIASTGYESFTLEDLDGKEIVAFGQNATPDVVLQTVLADYNFDVEPVITYVDSATSAQAAILTDPSTIVLMAEPALSVLGLPTKLGEELDVIDLQEAWGDVTGSTSYPMAGIFVKNDLDTDALDAYLEAVRESVEQANNDTATVSQMAVDLEYGFPLGVLISSIPRSNLEFVNATDSREALETYFGYILDLNGALIGGSLPTDNFYYSGE